MEAEGDLYGLTMLRTGPLAWLRLADDDVEVADHELLQVASGLPRTSFTVQSYYHLVGRTNLELYRDQPKEAFAWVEGHWKALRRSLLQRVSVVRLLMGDLRGRAALALAAKLQGTERKQKLGAVVDIAKRLAREGYGCSDGFAAQLRTGVLALRGQRQDAARSAEEAHRAFVGNASTNARASTRSYGVAPGSTTTCALARACIRETPARRTISSPRSADGGTQMAAPAETLTERESARR